MNIEEYRKDKDNPVFIADFKSRYPTYYEYIEPLHKKFYGYDSTEITMGCSYAVYSHLLDNVLKNKPKHIIEYGPGFTTLLFLRAFKDLNYTPKFTSYENDPTFFKILVDNGFNEENVIELVDLEVVDAGDTYHCTYLHDLDKHKDVDFVFIDGPGHVSLNDKRKPNINLNLKLLSDNLQGKKIMYMIDGRRDTQVFYQELFPK